MKLQITANVGDEVVVEEIEFGSPQAIARFKQVVAAAEMLQPVTMGGGLPHGTPQSVTPFETIVSEPSLETTLYGRAPESWSLGELGERIYAIELFDIFEGEDQIGLLRRALDLYLSPEGKRAADAIKAAIHPATFDYEDAGGFFSVAAHKAKHALDHPDVTKVTIG